MRGRKTTDGHHIREAKLIRMAAAANAMKKKRTPKSHEEAPQQHGPDLDGEGEGGTRAQRRQRRRPLDALRR
jgi:hypothetical protein